MASIYSVRFSTKRISEIFVFFIRFGSGLHGLIRACITDTLAFNVAVPFNDIPNEPRHVISNNVAF